LTLFRRHVLGLEGLTADEITLILDTAASLKEINFRFIKKVPILRGKTVVHFFYEASTRTRTSFEIAAKRLSADTVSLSTSTSSISKGESLIDTAKNLEAMVPDLIVIRHSMSGVPHLLAQYLSSSIINAGDGTHEHPSQGLLDMLTIREKKGRFCELNVTIIGDIIHSRVARSDIIGLNTMGAKIRVFGPRTLVPSYIQSLGVEIASSMNEAVEEADVIIILRVQKERFQDIFFPSTREYAQFFGLSLRHLKQAKSDVIIMHPGPVNWGVELLPDITNGPWFVILDQVLNGVAVRMALLYLLIDTEVK